MTDPYYPPRTVSNVVHEAVGAASMCWQPRPAGVFESDIAADIAAKLMKELGLNPDEVVPGGTDE